MCFQRGNVVCHAPRKISAICSLFMLCDGSYTIISKMMALSFINTINNGSNCWVIISYRINFHGSEDHKNHENL